MISWVCYARFADVPRLTAEGWIVLPTNLGPTHGFWSLLMQWAGEGDPPGTNPSNSTGA